MSHAFQTLITANQQAFQRPLSNWVAVLMWTMNSNGSHVPIILKVPLFAITAHFTVLLKMVTLVIMAVCIFIIYKGVINTANQFQSKVFDWDKAMQTILDTVCEISGMPVVPSRGLQEIPDYPYVTYDIPTRNIPEWGDTSQTDSPFLSVFTFTVYATDFRTAFVKSDELTTLLADREYRLKLREKANVVVVDESNARNESDNFFDGTVFQYAVDITFRFKRNYVSGIETINQVDTPKINILKEK